MIYVIFKCIPSQKKILPKNLYPINSAPSSSNLRSLYCRLNCSVQIWVQKRNLRFLHQSTISDGQVCSSTFTVAKGKEISQGNLGAFNFPKKQQKHLPNFCPSIEEVVKSKNMQTIFYTNYGLFNIMKCPYFLLRPFFSC